MPLFTFRCTSDPTHEEEVLCRYDQRDDLAESCQACGAALRWQGVELFARRGDHLKPRYQMNAIMHDGNKLPISNLNTEKKRRDS